MIGRPATAWSTLGLALLIRVPCPAAMMMALVNGLAAEAAGVTADFISASSFGRKRGAPESMTATRVSTDPRPRPFRCLFIFIVSMKRQGVGAANPPRLRHLSRLPLG